MIKYLFCVSGSKLEAYSRLGKGKESLLQGHIYLWEGAYAAETDNGLYGPNIIVRRPGTSGPRITAREDAFIPLEEVAEFFAQAPCKT